MATEHVSLDANIGHSVNQIVERTNRHRIGRLADFEDVASDYFTHVKTLRAIE